MLNATLLVAALIGAAFAAQPSINATAAQVFGSAIPAAVLSIAITLAASSALMVFTKTVPTGAMMTALPWWVVFGGLIGLAVVAGGAAIVPITGVALFFVCFVTGQLAGSLLLDHFGAFGLAQCEVTPLRLLGLLCTLAGVLLVKYG